MPDHPAATAVFPVAIAPAVARRILPQAGRVTTVSLLCLVAAACAPQPSSDAVLAAARAPAPASAIEQQAWWGAFDDATLNRLVQAGLRQNLDLRAAVERITEAGAGIGVRSGEGLSGTFDAARSRGDSSFVRTATFQGTWLIDLFGQNRLSRQAAMAGRDAARFEADAARLALVAEIAATYIDLRYVQEVMALTRRSVEGRSQSMDLISSQFEMGAATRLDVLRAQQLVAIAEAQQPALEVQFERGVNRLATLTAQPADALRAGLQRGSPQPRAKVRLAGGIPAEALRQRPDVQAAERLLAARMAQVGVAQAGLYPSLSLFGSVIAVPGGGDRWSFGPSINLPFLTGGQSQAKLTVAQSQARQAWLSWQRTVLEAVEESRNALAAYQRDGRNIAAQARLVAISQETLDLARSSYELGETDFLSILDTEVALLDARRAQAEAERDRAVNFVRLSVAVAGSRVP